MDRVKGVLGQWSLLAAGLLAGGLLVLSGHQGRPAQPASYTIPQVLAGWHLQPATWAGHTMLHPVRQGSPHALWVVQPAAEAGRTVLVRGVIHPSCDPQKPFSPPAVGPAVPCAPAPSGWPTFFLYDPASRALLPLYWWGGDVSLANGPAVYRVRLRAWSDCGPLGLGRHPCLVGEAPHVVP